MLEGIFRHLVLPAFEDGIKGRGIFRTLKELERTQWLPLAEIEKIQFSALQKLIAYTFNNCPYYREDWISRRLQPGQLRSLEQFQQWPVITRDTIASSRELMRSRAPGLKLISKSTGGSTGVPLQFDLDTGSNERRMASWARGYGWGGAGPGTKQVMLWGVPLVARSRKKQLKDWLYNRLYRRTVLNTFALSEDCVPKYLLTLKMQNPDVIVAYSQSLYVFARSISDRGLEVTSPKGIIVGAEKLLPFQRKLIESVFGAPVFETYGSREFMLMGAECERHEGLHLTMESILLEVLDDDGQPTPDGEEGNVVVTDLYNYGMPFIRYVNGDRAIAGFQKCSCGRGLPLLREIVGRRADIINTPDGRHVTGLVFPHLLKDFSAIRRFRVVQEHPNAVRVELVVTSNWSDSDRVSVENIIRPILGPLMQIEITLVDDIPLTKSGKQQVVINRCVESVTNSSNAYAITR